MKIWFWLKMIIIFGFLSEKCIRLEVLSILSQSEQIYQGLELSQLYRNLYGEMSFWPQWRHHYLARKLKKFAKTSKKQLLRCGFFCSPAFLKYFHHVHYWKWCQFPFNPINHGGSPSPNIRRFLKIYNPVKSRAWWLLVFIN